MPTLYVKRVVEPANQKLASTACTPEPIHNTDIIEIDDSTTTLAINVTSHIHLIIILSAISSLRNSSTLLDYVSLTYKITLCTHILLNFPFSLSEKPLVVNIGPSLLKLILAFFVLFSTRLLRHLCTSTFVYVYFHVKAG